MSLDLLIIGAHPDDAEWGAGGIALLLQQQGRSFSILDLTRGEMGSRGTPTERALEAEEAARFLGASSRENLEFPDCGLVDTPEARLRIASVIRRLRPKLVLAPYWEDRHPDHAAAGSMVRNAALYCTLRKVDDQHPPYKPAGFLYFLLHHFERPSLVVDISEVYERKLELLRIHRSQFAKTAAGFGVLSLGMSDYLFGLESRDRFFGSLIGVHHGEALVTERPLKLTGLEQILTLNK